ncbi:MAG: hypothetical protein CMJ83_16535 [Planctomycetes bacterium]|nr:hypothetical protein [Planctomycetota bacterium]
MTEKPQTPDRNPLTRSLLDQDLGTENLLTQSLTQNLLTQNLLTQNLLTQNLYCSGCLCTRAFVAMDRGYQCPACRKVLLVTDPPITRIDIRQLDLSRAQAS